MMKAGDLVIIRNTDIIESFVLRDALIDETLLGLLIELEHEDQKNAGDDVWVAGRDRDAKRPDGDRPGVKHRCGTPAVTPCHGNERYPQHRATRILRS